MATILEGALWTLTEAAAERMVQNGLLVKCLRPQEHACTPHDATEADKPFYHISLETQASWLGMSTLPKAIEAAEAAVEAHAKAQVEEGSLEQLLFVGEEDNA